MRVKQPRDAAGGEVAESLEVASMPNAEPRSASGASRATAAVLRRLDAADARRRQRRTEREHGDLGPATARVR